MKNYSRDFIQYSDKKAKEESKNIALYLTIHITLYIILLFFFIFFTWYTVFVSTHKFYAVYGISMKGTLNQEISDTELHPEKLAYDGVYIDKLGKIKTGEIIVLDLTEEKSVIKRLMAQEGDYISIAVTKNDLGQDCFKFYRIENGTDLTDFDDSSAIVDETSGALGYTIYSESSWYSIHNTSVGANTKIEVDGKTVEYEDRFYYTFLKNEYGTSDSKYEYFVSNAGQIYVKVPQGKVFYMGDNRARSTDGRERGFADRKNVVGRCEFIVKDFSFWSRIGEVIKYYFAEVQDFFAR